MDELVNTVQSMSKSTNDIDIKLPIVFPPPIYYALFAATNALAGLSIMWQNVINYIILYTISINIGLGVFNLIPLPPLDGSKVLMHFLPAKGKEWFYNNQQIFYVVFLLIWITGLSSVILQPAFTAVYAGIRWVVEKLFRLLSLI